MSPDPTSLIKALASIIKLDGTHLRQRRQRVACITYTEIASAEIWADVGNNPLIHVSTIHSFMWMIVKPFQNDIRTWVIARIAEKLDELRREASNFGPRVQQSTRDKNQREIARYEQEQGQISQVEIFKYGPGSDYSRGILGHDDVLRISTQFLIERRVFRTLLAQQFPVVLVDESQDTTESVVTALKAVATQMGVQFCLGFFGDPMQRIYMTGAGAITAESGWRSITKPENFRCPTSVLSLANAIRREGDGIIQTRGRVIRVADVEQPVVGTARLFILPSDSPRDERVAAVREWIAQKNDDPTWQNSPISDVKVLVIVHRMAATRLGFGQLYAAFNDHSPEAFKNGFLDATAWPVRPFVQFVLPLANAIINGEEFEAMTLLRQFCPLLSKDILPKDGVAKLLSQLREASAQLADMLREGNASVRQVLMHVKNHQLMALDPRVVGYLDIEVQSNSNEKGAPDSDERNIEIDSISRFFECSAIEFWGYQSYVHEQSPFSTQQGIKGAEFSKVLVIVDDEEGTHLQFSYDKYFGIKPLSARDHKNLAEGKETQVERTRRLFYVCCTRAMTDLAVVLFTSDVHGAESAIRAKNLFPPNEIFTASTLHH